MGLHGVVPKAFTRLSKKGVPYIGLIFSFVVGIILLFMGIIPALGNVYVMLASMACACGIVCVFFTVLSSFVYKKKFPDEYNRLSWKMPCKPLFFVIGIVGCLILFWSAFASDVTTLIATRLFFAVLMVFYQFYSKQNSEKLLREEEK